MRVTVDGLLAPSVSMKQAHRKLVATVGAGSGLANVRVEVAGQSHDVDVLRAPPEVHSVWPPDADPAAGGWLQLTGSNFGADASKVEDPSLIIYNAMIPNGSYHAVSNGSQTDVIDAGMRAGKSFDESLMGQRHEPDAPNFTPRISGVTNVDDGSCALSVVARSPVGDTLSEHRHFRFLAEVRRA